MAPRQDVSMRESPEVLGAAATVKPPCIIERGALRRDRACAVARLLPARRRGETIAASLTRLLPNLAVIALMLMIPLTSRARAASSECLGDCDIRGYVSAADLVHIVDI